MPCSPAGRPGGALVTSHADLFHRFDHLLDPARPEGWLCPTGGLSRCPAGAHLLLAAIIWADLDEPQPPAESGALLVMSGWCLVATDGQVTGKALTREQQAALRYVAGHYGIDPAFAGRLRDGIARLPVVDVPPPLPKLPPRLGPLGQRVPAAQHNLLVQALERGSLAGWMDPEGRLHLCQRYGHIRAANRLCGLLETANGGWDRLERAGWVMVSDNGVVSLPDQGWTQAQLDTIGDLLGETQLKLAWRQEAMRGMAGLHAREQGGR